LFGLSPAGVRAENAARCIRPYAGTRCSFRSVRLGQDRSDRRRVPPHARRGRSARDHASARRSIHRGIYGQNPLADRPAL